jgi:hypothetical protein
MYVIYFPLPHSRKAAVGDGRDGGEIGMGRHLKIFLPPSALLYTMNARFSHPGPKDSGFAYVQIAAVFVVQ